MHVCACVCVCMCVCVGGITCILSSKLIESTLVEYEKCCFIQLQVRSQQINSDLLCEVPGDSPNPRRTLESNCTECFPGLDLSTDCSTCEGESIQCVEEEQNCGVNLIHRSNLYKSSP